MHRSCPKNKRNIWTLPKNWEKLKNMKVTVIPIIIVILGTMPLPPKPKNKT